MKVTVGTMEMAQGALAAYRQYRAKAEIPEGWAYLGEGVSRTAFLGPDGVAYKVGSWFCNSQEVNGVAAATECSNGEWYAAPCTLWLEGVGGGSVLAMAYIQGDTDDDFKHTRMLEAAGFSDVHTGNYLVVRGIPVVIDVGFGFDDDGQAAADFWNEDDDDYPYASSLSCTCSYCLDFWYEGEEE